ncbi:MAG: hypothetical protein M0R51_05870 [Clostridia bacterium]|jgi:hypothetical protein|nr:hypothetical protein [Clostridia bacterium]
MGFVRQRDIRQKEKAIFALEEKCRGFCTQKDKNALFDAKNDLERMTEEYKKYEELFSEMR